MNEAWPAIVGLLLGTIFFGGLWWTVERGVTAKVPALWFTVSLLLRTAVVLVGFYLISNNDWRRIVACGLGFLVAKVLVTVLSGPPALAGGRR